MSATTLQTPQPSTSDAANPKKIKLCHAVATSHSIYPTQTNEGNPYDNYCILKQMGHLASQSDLAKLNGLNSNFYVSLKSDYLDAVWQRTIYINDLNAHVQSIVQDGTKLILSKDWNPGLAKYYKKLEISSLFSLVPLPHGISDQIQLKIDFARSIVEDVLQYITTAQVNCIIADDEIDHDDDEDLDPVHVHLTGATIASFFNKFPNLKKLKLQFDIDTAVFSQTELEKILIGITPNNNIQITVSIQDCGFQQGPIIQLGRIMMLFPNIKLELQFFCSSDLKLQELLTTYNLYRNCIDGMSLGIQLNQVNMTHQTVVTCLTQLCPIVHSLSVHLDNDTENWNVFQRGNNWEKLRSLTTYGYKGPLEILNLCPELENLELHHDLTPHIFYDPNQENIEQYFGNFPNWGDNWPNLRTLSIHGYNGPLDILKHCPKLEKLKLHVDQTRCIFHNPNQTAQEDIKQYFGNLPQLKELTFLGRPRWQRGPEQSFWFVAGEPLYVYLKTRARGVKINNWPIIRFLLIDRWMKAGAGWAWFVPGNQLHVFLKTLLPEGVKINCW